MLLKENKDQERVSKTGRDAQLSASPALRRGNLVADLVAGLTTGVANIPDAMASSILAGANPIQGLYAIMIGTPLGALFGSSAYMNIATTSALSITAGMALTGYSEETRAAAIATLAVLIGLLMAAAGLLNMGRLLRFVSNSVVIGFLTGVSINVVFSQLGDFTGYYARRQHRSTGKSRRTAGHGGGAGAGNPATQDQAGRSQQASGWVKPGSWVPDLPRMNDRAHPPAV